MGIALSKGQTSIGWRNANGNIFINLLNVKPFVKAQYRHMQKNKTTQVRAGPWHSFFCHSGCASLEFFYHLQFEESSIGAHGETKDVTNITKIFNQSLIRKQHLLKPFSNRSSLDLDIDKT